MSNNINGPARRRGANGDKPVESLCAQCADRAFPCTSFWACYPRRDLFERPALAMLLAISRSSAARSAMRREGSFGGLRAPAQRRGRDDRRARGVSPAWRIGEPAPGASGRETVQVLPTGRREAMGRQGDAPDGTSRLCTEAGVSKPQGLRSPRAQAGGRRDGPARVRPRPGRGRCERPLRGGWKSGQRQEARSAQARRQNGTVRGKAGFAKGRAEADDGRLSLAGKAGRGDQRSASLPGEAGREAPERPTALADRESGRLPRRQAVSCRARAGFSRENRAT